MGSGVGDQPVLRAADLARQPGPFPEEKGPTDGRCLSRWVGGWRLVTYGPWRCASNAGRAPGLLQPQPGGLSHLLLWRLLT